MKKIVSLILCCAMALSFAACAAGKYSPSEYSNSVVNDKVQMFIPQKTVTDETDEFTVSFENMTEDDYSYDATQRLEIWKDNQWCVVKDKQDFTTLELHVLPAATMDERTFFVADHYGKLAEGRYRVVMIFTDHDGNQTLAAAEFGIGRVDK